MQISSLGTARFASAQSHTVSDDVRVPERIDFFDGADTIRLFVNPTPGGPAPATAAATKTDRDLPAIDRIRIFATDANGDPLRSFDEIRLGTTFADVSPVPEPGSLGLLSIGLATWAGRRRVFTRR